MQICRCRICNRMPFLARELVGWQKCLKEFLIPHSNVERDHNDSNSVLLDCTLMTFSSLLASTQKRLADIHVICPVSFGGLQTHHRLFPNIRDREYLNSEKKSKCSLQIDVENFTPNLRIFQHHIYLFHLFHMKYFNIYSKIVQINKSLFRHI